MTERDIQRQLMLREGLIRAFYTLIQTVRLYQENNRMLIESADSLMASVKHLCETEAELTIQFIGKRLYIQDEKILYRPETSNLYDHLFHYFDNRELQGIRFYSAIQNISLKHLLTFINILNRTEQQKSPLTWLTRQLKKNNMTWVKMLHKPKEDTELTRKERAKRAYSYVLASVKEVAQKLSIQHPVGLSRARRIIQNMVDIIMEDEPLFRALSTVRIYDDYTYSHSVNVAILAMCLGKRVRLSHRSLERLGLCGLLHDLGKIEIPKPILNKPSKLTQAEFDVMKTHSLISVRLITKIRAERDRKAKILLPPFEHHLKYDLSGYPQTRRKKDLSLFGRILTIADVYDAVTSPRIYRPTSLSPDQALGIMLKGIGKDFDPILLKVFINMMGVYPLGTLLKLDKGVGLVTISPEDISHNDAKISDETRPWVLLLASDGKGGVKGAKTVSLAERDPRTGKYLRNIVASFNPSDYGIQPLELLLD